MKRCASFDRLKFEADEHGPGSPSCRGHFLLAAVYWFHWPVRKRLETVVERRGN